MTKPNHSSTPKLEKKSLNYDHVYHCPVCRYGEISVLTLTESFACNFCRHIFNVNIEEQLLIMADSSQPMAWRWNGRNWRTATQEYSELTFAVWFLGLALVILPTLIVAVSAYIFPTAEESYAAWFPNFWIGLTFLSHFIFVFWLLAENYQLPFYEGLKVKLRDLLNR